MVLSGYPTPSRIEMIAAGHSLKSARMPMSEVDLSVFNTSHGTNNQNASFETVHPNY